MQKKLLKVGDFVTLLVLLEKEKMGGGLGGVVRITSEFLMFSEEEI